MLAIIRVYPFLEIIINFKVHMTVHDIVHMESHGVLITNFYPVSNTWIVRVELKYNILQVSTKFLIEE